MSSKSYAKGSTLPNLKPRILRLYSMRFCPFAQRTRLVLAYKNIPHETVNVHLKNKPDWFLALNPLGQVPVLQIDDTILGSLFAIPRATPDELGAKIEELQNHLRFYEEKLVERGSGPFFGGAQPAMVDLYIWSPFERLPAIAITVQNPAVGVDENNFPKLASWVKAMQELPAVKTESLDSETHHKFMIGYRKGEPDYDMGLE